MFKIESIIDEYVPFKIANSDIVFFINYEYTLFRVVNLRTNIIYCAN